MMRSAFAGIAGVVVGIIIVFIAEAVGHMIFPPPEGVDLSDPDQLRAIMDEIPLGAKIAVLVAWGLGTFGGGVVGVALSGRKAWPATVVAIVMLAMAGLTLYAIPHPLWMVGATIVITGFSWLLATRFAKSED
ncbi:MAG: MauE/DoxX family redox-associated membrane protein [Pseudomonadota bacterium]